MLSDRISRMGIVEEREKDAEETRAYALLAGDPAIRGKDKYTLDFGRVEALKWFIRFDGNRMTQGMGRVWD